MGTGKAVLRGTFMAMQAYREELEKAQVNNGNLYQKDIEK